MAVIYLFNAAKNLRKQLKTGVQEVIHNEGEYNAITQILAKDAPEYGDYFGFQCVDGRFRLFWITEMDINDEAGTCMLTGIDAAIAELEGKVVTWLPMENTTAAKAVTAALQGTGWSIGTQTGDGQVNTESAYFATLWATIKRAAAAGGVRAVPYYEFSGNQITAKKIDLLDKTPVFSGLIYTRRRGAQNIHITHAGTPYGRVFPVGKIIGDGEPPEQVTIADAVWSRANGDPADKPAGQKYIDLPGAISDAEYVYEDKKETDPAKLMQKAFADLEATQKPIASGTANLSDMEYMPGYEHMQAQMWMMAVVRAETGQMVETTIINIERYYVHRELTKITVGDEDADEDTLENMLSSMQAELLDTVRVAGGGSAGAGKAKQMVLEAEELIQLNSKQIQANADQITLRAFSADVVKLADETEVNFREVYVDIDLNRAEISATNQFVDNLNNEVSGINATLTVQANQISAKASQYDLDALGNRVATAESELIVQAGQISTKVSENGVISSINQTAEVIKIEAQRVNLSGYVTASTFEAEMAAIENMFSGMATAGGLNVSGTIMTTNLDVASNLKIFGSYTHWEEIKLYRGGTISVSQTTTRNVSDANGNTIGYVTVPIAWSFSPSSNGTYNFLTQVA